jgi:hypothetical protein
MIEIGPHLADAVCVVAIAIAAAIYFWRVTRR